MSGVAATYSLANLKHSVTSKMTPTDGPGDTGPGGDTSGSGTSASTRAAVVAGVIVAGVVAATVFLACMCKKGKNSRVCKAYYVLNCLYLIVYLQQEEPQSTCSRFNNSNNLLCHSNNLCLNNLL